MGTLLESFNPTDTIGLDCGMQTIGSIGPDKTPLFIFEPYDYDPEHGSHDFLLATGLLARPEQYRHLGQGLLRMNDRLIVVGYDHNYHQYPIRANAEAILDTTQRFETGNKFVAIGHSMGTIAMLLALEDPEFHKRTKALIQANPAMTGSHLLMRPTDIMNVEREAVVLTATHPLEAFSYTYTAADEFLHRPRVIANQVKRLLFGAVHERYEFLMKENPDLPIFVFYNKRDGLVPARWGASVASMGGNVQVYIHNSRTGLAHAALNLDPEYAVALHSVAENTKLPKSFQIVSAR